MLNYALQFIKIRLVFHTPYLRNEAIDPQCFISFLKQVKVEAAEVFKKSIE